jgi:hypothetical protein
MTTIDTLMALADTYAHAKCDVPHAIDYGSPSELDVAIVEHAKARAAIQSALTEVLDQLDIQAGSIEAVQAANQRLAQAAQPVRKPLTLDRIQEIYINTYNMGYHGRDFEMAFVRAIERSHGIGSDV